MKRIIWMLIALSSILTVGYGQYYTEGQDPFSVRWRQIRTDRYRVLYPQENEWQAQRIAHILDTAYNQIHYGLSRSASRVPVILRAHNLNSNGFVSWAPRRSELVISPPTETYASPWLKQLTLHEYRHVVQMSNLNRNFVRVITWFGGEQVIGATAALLLKWYLEGDAVLAETGFSTYGRALQPEFTLGYRAYAGSDEFDRFPMDKWFCGSYKDFIPNYYELGYQMINHSYLTYGPKIWEDVYDITTKYPFLIFTKNIAFHKYYRTSVTKMFEETFDDLLTLWAPGHMVPNSARIVETPHTSYTLYSYPVPVNDSCIIAVKYDYDKAARLVSVDPRSGNERHITFTGNISSRPVYSNGMLLWTEFRPSLFWEQKNRSQVRSMHLDGPFRPTPVRLSENLFYPTFLSDGSTAAVEYRSEGKYAINIYPGTFEEGRISFEIPQSISLHGMAFDPQTGTLAVIALSEQGMYLARVDRETGQLQNITRPSAVTINHLSAAKGRLFFNSIRSGLDETHGYDLTENREYRLTTSTYGSVMPSASSDPVSDLITQVSYRKEGYFISVGDLSEPPQEEIEYAPVPQNRINLPVYDWKTENLDTIELFSGDNVTDTKPSKRYCKGLNLFNFHSWAPLSYDVYDVADERNLNLEFGATVISQNTLSNTEMYLSYGRVDGDNWYRGGFRYLGFAPKIEINAEYDGGNRWVYNIPRDEEGNLILPSGWNKKYFYVDAKVYLPFNLSSGKFQRFLTPTVDFSHSNSMFYNPYRNNFIEGYERGEYSITYNQYLRYAYRDLAPRWGFGAKVSYIHSPFHSDFGAIWSLYGQIYVPGILPHHSLRLRGVWQDQKTSVYNFIHKVLFPRGCDMRYASDDLWATVGEYRFPVAYPDWGWSGVFYLKRIALNLTGGYSRFKPVSNYRAGYMDAWSYGGEISLDIAPLRSVTDSNLKFGVYQTSDDGIATNFAISIGF